MDSELLGGIIVVAIPFLIWYGLEAGWKLGLWKFGRNQRARQVQNDLQEETLRD